ncbi:MAG: tRNA glutamyl-Q(34) synthetase GluQRS [Myxococcaceae bacterium]|nr:MAG: tRNA glutamyl-Q(34) synthetase GluQRS [Myxococcaceae bacterium]
MTATHRGRFAPSPTGRLHLGNAWAAALGWLWARSQAGEFLLRVEDLDTARSRTGLTEALLADQAWLGLEFDAPPVFQSRRLDLYRAAFERLRATGRVYPCFCTRSEIARAVSAPHGPADEGPRYPGTCLALSSEQVEERARTRPPAWRFRPREGLTDVHDLLHGRIVQDVAREVGDFVVLRNDGVPSYQLAVVVDDAEMGITHVLRGDDLLRSTARQIQLCEALGLPVPVYAHVPLLLGPDGKRLAKRAGTPGLAELRERGIAPERLVGLLAAWAGLGDGRPVDLQALVPRFVLERLPREPIAVDPSRVNEALFGPG